MKRVRIGGQAVMEGVMMKNGDRYAVAVRKPDKDIEVKVVISLLVRTSERMLRLT